MKISRKQRLIVLLVILALFSTGVSHGISMTSNPQIKTRGLHFNTGVSSDQIRMLKDFFRARGQSNVPWGYNYDSRTKELVRNYQSSVGIKADGIAGQSTIDRINREIAEKNLKLGLRIPTVNTKGDLIIINKSSNTLYFFRDGVIQNSYPVATGKTEGLTPSGRHTVKVKYVNPAWGGAGISAAIPGGAPNNPLGKRWIGISYGGGGRYGVHGNSNSRSIGTYASLGCIRMFNQDVEKFYEKVRIGIPIWIGSEDQLEKYGVKFISNYKEKEVIEEKKDEVEQKVNIKLDGEIVELSNSVINKKGTTYYPFREILELIDAQVIWDDENKTAVGVLDGKYVEFKLESNEYISNHEHKNLPEGQEVFINESRVYVPIRYLMEALGYEVDWDQLTSTVILNSLSSDIDEDEEVDEIGEEEIQEDEEVEDNGALEEDVDDIDEADEANETDKTDETDETNDMES